MTYRQRFFGGPLDGVWSTADSEGEPPEVVEITADGQRGSKYELVLVIDRPDGGAIALYRSGPGAAALNR